ncbi:MAG: hypothetical protein NZ853_09055 [Leptospiraceae bacterium]|nr:hypothetical protein [Leptospiraceae bacterium]MDW7975576.1 hypothetical protein [Leptospiraceae bacterium]
MTNALKRIQEIISKIPLYYFYTIYLAMMILLIIFYTKQAEFNWNLLLHIHEEFIQLNDRMKFKDMVVLKNEGYDGQFFYYIARYIYEKEVFFLYLDSSEFRFLRIFPSFVYGFVPAIYGWELYTYWVIFINIVLLFISTKMLHIILPQNQKYIAILYLFNPFSIISILLLIGDNLFISLFVMFVYFFHSSELSLTSPEKKQGNFKYTHYAYLILIFLSLTKETILFFLIPMYIIMKINKNQIGVMFSFFPLWFFFLWYIIVEFRIGDDPYIISLGSIQSHVQRIRIPLSTMLHVITEMITDFKISKWISNGLVLILWILLLFNLKNFFPLPKSLSNLQNPEIQRWLFSVPIVLTVLSIAIVDYEYWLAFDNIYRIYAFSFLWIIAIKVLNLIENYNDYGFLFLNTLITLFLIPRYLFLKKIGEFYILQ